jgi:hypothetical protein
VRGDERWGSRGTSEKKATLPPRRAGVDATGDDAEKARCTVQRARSHPTHVALAEAKRILESLPARYVVPRAKFTEKVANLLRAEGCTFTVDAPKIADA